MLWLGQSNERVIRNGNPFIGDYEKAYMKAKLQIDLKTSSPSEGQRILLELCEKWKAEGILSEYHFEIDAPDEPVSEKCVLSEEKIMA